MTSPEIEAAHAIMLKFGECWKAGICAGIPCDCAEKVAAFAAEAVAQERERCAKWHDNQRGAWLDQARNAQRLSHAGDDAERQEYRQQHERYAAYAILHRQAATAIRQSPDKVR